MRPPKSLLKDSHPELAKQVKDQSLLATLSTGSESKIEWIGPCGHSWFAKVYNRTNAKNITGCPICSGKQILIGFNDLATTHPDIAKLCNNPDDALTVTANSNKKITWKCPDCGQTWEAPVSRLTIQKSRCPYCAHHYATQGVNDLATLKPDLAEELLDKTQASQLQLSSNKKVKWQCHVNPNHIWEASVYARVYRHTGCPFCSNRLATPGVNDFGTLYPELAATLVHPEQAITVLPNSETKLEWRCSVHPNHTWLATPYNRIKSGCPICANKIIVPGFNDIATTHPDLAKELVDSDIATKISYGHGKKVEWKCKKGHTWMTEPYHRTGKDATDCPICNPTGTSKEEKELANIVEQLVYPDKIETNVKILDNHYELDIYVPSKNIAIEFNGTRWHSEAAYKDKNYHKTKYDMCLSNNIQLIQIWEDDWINKREIIIKLLAHKLHATKNITQILPDTVSTTIFARKLTPCVISSEEARPFLDTNHIQGYVTSTYYVGLKDKNNNLHAVLAARSPKNNARMHRKQGEWEIQRYATDCSIPGGFTKLMKFAEQTIKNNGHDITTWVSFSANDVSNGTMYAKTGFIKDKELPPDYKYVGDFTNWKRTPKERFQKKCFKDNPKLLWEDGWTERQAAAANKLYRIYDAGKIRWIKTI